LIALPGYAKRRIDELSGGQKQRVAIARALAVEPEVLLLDEPLSNLDAKLRVEMRGEIRELQQKLGITALYVTHDQEEALAISDRIAVMRAGMLEQVGRPAEIYARPATAFVAEFMGTTNLLAGTVAASTGGRIRIDAGGIVVEALAEGHRAGTAVMASLRPETLRLLLPREVPPPGWAQLEATVKRVELLGALTRVELATAGGTPLRLAMLDLPPEPVAPGRTVALAYDPARVAVFAAP
jgi:ABC-type Fe3+/spermidine/putrescine transport system ATPase subunit